MAKHFFVSSRGGHNDLYPGLIRGSAAASVPVTAGFDPKVEAFDELHLRNLIADEAPVGANYSVTAPSNTFTHTGAFNELSPGVPYTDDENVTTGLRGQWIRMLLASGVAIVGRIQTRPDANTVTVLTIPSTSSDAGYATGALPTGSTNAISAYFVGGGKASRSTMSTPIVAASVRWATDDSIFLSGYESGASVVNLQLPSVSVFGYRGTYQKATTANRVFEPTSNTKVFYDIDFESSGVQAVGLSTSLTLNRCRDFGLSGICASSSFPSTLDDCFSKTVVSASGSAGNYRSRCTSLDAGASVTTTTSGIIINSIYRTTLARTVVFLNHAFGSADFNTFEIVNSPNQPVVIVTGTFAGTYLQKANDITAGAAEALSLKAYIRDVSPDSRFYIVGQGILDASGFTAGTGVIWTAAQLLTGLLSPSSLEVGSSSTGGTRGAFAPGLTFSDFNATVGNAKAWNLVANMVITTGKLQMSGTSPFVAEAKHPRQDHAGSTITTDGHLIEKQASGALQWAWAIAKELNPIGTRDLRLKKILAGMSGLLATSIGVSIFDSDPANGNITIEITYWDSVPASGRNWANGDAGTLVSHRQLLADPFTEEVASHIQLRLLGKVEG